MPFASKWLSIIGIGEDGCEGLTPAARSHLNYAEILVGADRHLALIETDKRQRLLWKTPITDTITEILSYRGRSVCILASGDPMWYGIGVTLIKHIPLDEITIIPTLSTFSLICTRLGWAMTEVETLSLCGRPVELLQAYIYPNARLLVLSADRHTPEMVAKILTDRGFGSSSFTVLEHLGGAKEGIITGTAQAFNSSQVADLNAIAIQCIPNLAAKILPRTGGLPDSAYLHDGQLTKQEVRVITLSALAPNAGELLWDVGAGCGSIGIEWMRAHPRNRAIAIEKSLNTKTPSLLRLVILWTAFFMGLSHWGSL